MFLTRLKCLAISSNRRRLATPLVYRSRIGDTIEAPAEFVSCGFTHPWAQAALRLLTPYHRRSVAAAAVLRDYLTLVAPAYTRAEADRVFREAMADNEVPVVARWLLWAGARVASAWDEGAAWGDAW